MKIKAMMEELVRRYGQPNVVVRSEYHVQVLTGSKPHDIWVGTREGLKWRLSGSQRTDNGPPEVLLEELAAWSDKDSDFGKLQQAVSLCNFIGEMTRLAAREKLTVAVFVDAGLKDGKARVGVVGVNGEEVVARRLPVDARDITDAEYLAITLGIEVANTFGPDVPVFSDNRVAVERAGLDRVRWIRRGDNKPADSIANMRSR